MHLPSTVFLQNTPLGPGHAPALLVAIPALPNAMDLIARVADAAARAGWGWVLHIGPLEGGGGEGDRARALEALHRAAGLFEVPTMATITDMASCAGAADVADMLHIPARWAHDEALREQAAGTGRALLLGAHDGLGAAEALALRCALHAVGNGQVAFAHPLEACPESPTPTHPTDLPLVLATRIPAKVGASLGPILDGRIHAARTRGAHGILLDMAAPPDGPITFPRMGAFHAPRGAGLRVS